MKKLKITSFLLTFSACATLLLLTYLVLVRYVAAGYCVPHDTWLPNVQKIKTHLVKTAKTPKIVFWAGSNGIFSIDGAEVERITGMPVVNLCRHAAMPLRFAVYEAEHYLQEGDILVLPLENKAFPLEMNEKLFTDFSLNFLLGHSQEYQETLSWKEKWQLYFNYGPSWLFYRINEPMVNLRNIDENALLADWRNNRQSPSLFAYDYHFTNRYGEFSVTAPPHIDIEESNLNPFPDWIPGKDGVSKPFLRDYALLQKIAEKKKIKLILTMPTCYYYREQADKLIVLHQLLERHQIRIPGHPETFSFPEYLYFDTTYHMNAEGAKFNAHELGKVVLKETDPEKWKQCISVPWPHIVFADDPARCLPETDGWQLYATGVSVRKKTFSVRVPLPEELRGRELEMNLIVKPESQKKYAVAAIRAEHGECLFEEKTGLYRNEVAFYLSKNQTKGREIILSVTQTGKEIGLERLTMRHDPAANEEDKNRVSPVKDPGYFFFHKGFMPMEAWGCWTNNIMADFELRIPKQCRNKKFFLTFDVISSVNEKKPVCEFDVLTGKRKLAHVELRGNDDRFTICVPASALPKLPNLPLRLDFGGDISPEKCKKVEKALLQYQAWWLPKCTHLDTERNLGIGLKAVSFEVDIFDQLPFTCDFSQTDSFTLKNFNAYDQQGGGIWLNHQTGVIRIMTMYQETPALDVAIEGFPFLWKDMPEQMLEVCVNGKHLASFSYSDKKAIDPIRFSIPQTKLKSNGEFNLEFKFAKPLKSPQELGIFKDPRTLGFFFKKMTFTKSPEKITDNILKPFPGK